MMEKIWFDIGLVKIWSGPLGGVMRCEAQIAAALLEEHPEKVIFTYWDEANQLVEWGTPQLRNQLERMGILIPPPPPPPPPPLNPTEQLQAVFHFSVKVIWRIIKRIIKFWVGQGVLNLVSVGLGSIKREPPPLDSNIEELIENVQALTIGSNDVYVSVGAGWVIDRYSSLYHLKQERKFISILLCHDLIPVRFPTLTLDWIARIFPSYLCNLAWCADVVLCNSQITKRDLIAFIEDAGAPLPQLQVVQYGTQIQKQSQSQQLAEGLLTERIQAILEKPFILYVSTIEVRKNHEVLCRAYLELLSLGRTNLPLLVFVGSWGWCVDGLRDNVEHHPLLSKSIVVLEGLDDGQLSALYQGCLFTVYPSFYEGWGLPVAESLAFGKFCLASDAPSLKEVGGNLIEYLNGRDAYLWAQKIAWYFDHVELLLQKEREIARLFKPISWSQTAQQILDIGYASIKL